MNSDGARSGGIPVFWLILVLNLLLYAAMALEEGGLSFSPALVVDWGGIVPPHLMHGEYWRLLVAGFLHFSLIHLAANMLCLLAWGVPIERGIGSFRFAILYLASILGGAMGTLTLSSGIFVGAGASGGISGLLGALLALALMGRVRMPFSFFVINIGLNAAIPFMVPSVDWKAHLFGFLTGLVLITILVPRR